MTLALVLPLMTLLAAGPDDAAGWKEAAKTDGIIVYKRQEDGSNVAEMKATGMIDAEPEAVWRVVRDYNGYTKNMPYTSEGKVLKETGGGKDIWFYSVISAPLVSKRDYVIKLTDTSKWNEGQGYLRVDWKAVPGYHPEQPGLVRVQLNTGYWKLEPRDGGKKTFATYYVHTDPGGSIPGFIRDQANSAAVPDVFRAVRKHAPGHEKAVQAERAQAAAKKAQEAAAEVAKPAAPPAETAKDVP